jgi:hypothetical protein
MKKCRFYHEEFSFFILEANSNIDDLEMKALCKRPNLEAMGSSENSLSCDGDSADCPFYNHH